MARHKEAKLTEAQLTGRRQLKPCKHEKSIQACQKYPNSDMLRHCVSEAKSGLPATQPEATRDT
jgi:hypothetical protein